MRIVKLMSLLVLGLLAIPVAANAQSCLGLPSFANGMFRINGSLESADSSTAYAVGVGAGKSSSVFGNIGVGQVSYEGFDDKTNYGFIELGYQLPLSKAQICPVVGATYGTGPNDDINGIELTSQGISGGLAIGYTLAAGGFQIVPNAAVRYSSGKSKLEADGLPSFEESFDGGLFDIGLGFIFANRFSIQPLVHIPFSSDDEEAYYGIFASIALGKGR